MTRKIIIAIIILVVLVAIGWMTNIFNIKPAPDKSEKTLCTVKSGPLRISLVTKGIFDPKEVIQLTVGNSEETYYRVQRKLKFSFSQLKITKIVPEGTRVKKDDIIAEFDATELEEHIKGQEALSTEYKTQLTKAQENLAFEKRQLVFFMLLDDGMIETAKKEMERYVEEYPRLIKSKKIALEQTILELKKMKDALVAFYEKVDAGIVPDDSPEIESKRLALEQKKIAVEQEEKEYKLFTEFTVPQEISKREIDYKRALATKEKDQKEGEAKITRCEKAIKSLNERIEKHEELLKEVIEWRGRMVCKAPCDGLVLYGGSTSSGWDTSPSEIKEGNSLYIGQALIRIPSASEMKVSLQLNEREVQKVKVDMKAEMKPDAFPELIIPGIITKVAEMPTRTYNSYGNSSSEENFPIEILCQETDERLKPNMSTQVEIIIEEFENTLYVPVEAVFEKDKKTVCYVSMPDGSIKEQPVKLGLNNDDFVVVTEGLQEGDKVYLYDPFIVNK